MKKIINWANRITIVRFFLVPAFVISVIYYRPGMEELRIAALIIFLVAALTDAIDGVIARLRKQQTELGTFLDPAADKILLISAFVCLSLANKFSIRLPIWVSVIIISREIILVSGLAIIQMVTGSVKIAPNLVGKVTTFFQMLTVIVVLLNFRYSYLVWNIAVFFTVVSAISYIRRESKRLSEQVT